MNFEDHVNYAMRAHSGQTRRFDEKTPYSIHPLWCAMTIRTETLLPQDLREDGSLVLLYHDVKEDTNVGLSPDLPPRVVEWIDGMTYEGASAPGGSDIVRREVWKRAPEIRLFTLYDKTSNLLDAAWAPNQRIVLYKDFVRNLIDDIMPRYGELNIVKIARSIIL